MFFYTNFLQIFGTNTYQITTFKYVGVILIKKTIREKIFHKTFLFKCIRDEKIVKNEIFVTNINSK